MTQKTNYSLKNYFRPTPANILKISLAIKGVLGGSAISNAVMDGNKWLTISIMIIGGIADIAINLFSDAPADPENQNTSHGTTEN